MAQEIAAKVHLDDALAQIDAQSDDEVVACNSKRTQALSPPVRVRADPGIWIWHAQVNIPGPPFLDNAKQQFKAAWLVFKDKHGHP
jgi:hypothetical protein